MLKPIDPEDRLAGAAQHLGERAAAVGFVAIVIYVFFFADFDTGGDLRYGLEIAAFALSFAAGLALSSVAWQAATIWLGRLNFRNAAAALAHPKKFPADAREFVEAWWQNELVLDVFFSVVHLLCMVASFFALQRLVDMVAPNVR